MNQTPCVIFAGGKSSRMGEDKALLPFANHSTLIEFQYKRLKQIFQDVYISCKDASKFDFEAEFIEDEKDIFAPTIGFVSAFNRLHVKHIFVLSVDTPFVSENEIKEIIKQKDKNFDAIIAEVNNSIHPLCGLYSRSLYVSFTAMLQNNEHKLTRLLHNSNTLFIKFNNEKNFLNLNYKEEYQEALLRVNTEKYY